MLKCLSLYKEKSLKEKIWKINGKNPEITMCAVLIFFAMHASLVLEQDDDVPLSLLKLELAQPKFLDEGSSAYLFSNALHTGHLV